MHNGLKAILLVAGVVFAVALIEAVPGALLMVVVLAAVGGGTVASRSITPDLADVRRRGRDVIADAYDAGRRTGVSELLARLAEHAFAAAGRTWRRLHPGARRPLPGRTPPADGEGSRLAAWWRRLVRRRGDGGGGTGSGHGPTGPPGPGPTDGTGGGSSGPIRIPSERLFPEGPTTMANEPARYETDANGVGRTDHGALGNAARGLVDGVRTVATAVGAVVSLGTAGRAGVAAEIAEWETSHDARQHPETFLSWIHSRYVAARQRPDTIAACWEQHHGRGPAGHMGVPEYIRNRFLAAYEAAAEAEAAAWQQFGADYAAYVDAANEELPTEFGREVLGSAYRAHRRG